MRICKLTRLEVFKLKWMQYIPEEKQEQFCNELEKLPEIAKEVCGYIET